LDETAAEIGHTAKMCRDSYLSPGLEDAYMSNGSVPDKISSMAHRIAALYYQDTSPEGMVGETPCPLCGAVNPFRDDTQDDIYCVECGKSFTVVET